MLSWQVIPPQRTRWAGRPESIARPARRFAGKGAAARGVC